MAEPKLDLGKTKGFDNIKTEKKQKHSLFGILLILVGIYFLIQDKVDFLNDSKIYNGVSIALIVIGIIVFLVRRK